MPSEPFVIAADAVIAMDEAYPKILQNAGVVVQDDRIAGVGELADIQKQFGTLPIRKERGILLPGFINAHTHLELSYQNAQTLKSPSFPAWVAALMAHYPPSDSLEIVIREAFTRGITQSLRAGVTTLGDISRHAAITRDQLAVLAQSSPSPRVVSYAEVMGLGNRRHQAHDLILASATMPSPPPTSAPLVSLPPCLLIPGISPHAPYTVEGPVLRACLRHAIIHQLPLAMHLAELPDEAAFLSTLTGTLARDLLQKLNILDDQIPLMPGGPIRWAQRWGLIIADAHDPHPRSIPVLLAHVNYCSDAELAQLAAARLSIAYCPRTHAYFGHPPHRYRDFLASGINVCLATDSLASNPDLNVLRETQFLFLRDQTDPYTLLAMITRRPAAALGLAEQIGTISPGKFADLVLLPIPAPPPSSPVAPPDGDLIEHLIRQAPEPSVLWLRGIRIDPPGSGE